MYGIRTGNHRCADNLLHIQITVFCCSRSDTDRLIGKLCMKCLPVCFGIHCNSFNSHLSASTDDADGNLSSVCNQYFPNHYVLLLSLLRQLLPQFSILKLCYFYILSIFLKTYSDEKSTNHKS